jgi:glycosyltransferase involved in cell wall biosynthesis
MRILICAQQAPLPPPDGFRLQVGSLLAELQRRHEVRVLALAFPNQHVFDIEDGDGMRLVPIVETTGFSKAMRRVSELSRGHRYRLHELAARLSDAVCDELQSFRPDVVHVAGTYLAPLGGLVERIGVLAPLDAAYVNAEARVLCGSPARKWLLRREAARVRLFEASEYRRFRRVVVVSHEDAAALRHLDPSLTLSVIPNGVDPVGFAPDAEAVRQPGRVVFAGVMNAAPNVSAAEFLACEVMPLVRQLVASAHLVIVGRDPVPAVLRLSRLPGIQVVGEVADMRAWLTSSDVCACPMISGTGIKNKLLEGMACGLPCVVTPRALRGVTAVPGRDLLVGEDAVELAEQVVLLLRNPVMAQFVSRSGRAYVVANHSWPRVADAYVAVYESVLGELACGRD